MKAIIRAIVVLTIAASVAMGTTVRPIEVGCPICGKSFIANAVTSFSTFGEPARDLRDDSSFICDSIKTCPWCLYSAFASDFRSLPDEEAIRIRKALASLMDQLASPSTLGPAGIYDDSLTDDDMGLLIAGVCYALREQDPSRNLDLLRYAYRRTVNRPDSSQHKACRDRLIHAIGGTLNKDSPVAEQKAVSTYLLGELERLAGNHQAAGQHFGQARELAASLAGPGTTEWLTRWCNEQALRNQAGMMTAGQLEEWLQDTLSSVVKENDVAITTRAAIEALTSRPDPEAWAAVLRFSQRSPWNLVFLQGYLPLTAARMQIHPPMQQWVQTQFEKAAKRMEDNAGPDPDPVWAHLVELKKSLLAREVSIASSSDALLRQWATALFAEIGASDSGTIPVGWEPDTALELVAVGLAANEPKAAEFLVAWARTAKSPQSLRYSLSRCWEALAESPLLWPVVLKQTDQIAGTSDSEWIACLRFVCGDQSAGRRLEVQVRSAGEWSRKHSMFLDCFQAKKHPGLADYIIDRWATDADLDFSLSSGPYLSTVCTPVDLPRLETLAAAKQISDHDMPRWDREEVESVIRSIHLRPLVEHVRRGALRLREKVVTMPAGR